MRIVCTAVAEGPLRRKNLAQCIEILGGTPIIDRDNVGVDFTGTREQIEKFEELFEMYVRSDIKVFD